MHSLLRADYLKRFGVPVSGDTKSFAQDGHKTAAAAFTLGQQVVEVIRARAV